MEEMLAGELGNFVGILEAVEAHLAVLFVDEVGSAQVFKFLNEGLGGGNSCIRVI